MRRVKPVLAAFLPGLLCVPRCGALGAVEPVRLPPLAARPSGLVPGAGLGTPMLGAASPMGAAAALLGKTLATPVPLGAGPVAAAPDGDSRRLAGAFDGSAATGPSLVTADLPRTRGMIAPGTWERLAAPDAAALKFLTGRIPGLKTAQVRELPKSQALELLENAVSRQLSALDVFSDQALRTDKIYHISQDTLAAIDQRYQLNSLFPIQGKTLDGKTFKMQAIVMGAGKVEMLYDHPNGFTFRHPVFAELGGKYQLPGRLTQDINGPGKVSFHHDPIFGIGPLNVRIRIMEFNKASATKVTVKAGCIHKDERLYPIQPR